ncbi:MAG TPA: Wzz/FepE/Etk N-terminal domain-containing protein [Terriglobia bacterium]|nr:Wzz/FepE/Etk N-terminal domain-containing protein [Terriglobia bacterium]
MLVGRQLNLEDYWGILRRRYWLILIPVLLGPIAAYFIAKQLPPRYTSTSLILIEQPKVPASIVPSIVGNDLVARLAAMEEQILSRSRLEPIIRRYGLYKDDINHVPIETLVERMRESIVVKPVSFSNTFDSSGQQGNQVPGFQISFTADTPRLAQSVCSEITSMFVEENLRLRERRAEGTTDFIQTQLQQAKQKLDEQDARLAAFKRQYFGALPDQEQSTIQIIGNLTSQLNSLSDALGRAQQDRTYTESLLTQQLAAWKASQTGVGPETLQQQLVALENHLIELRSRYTDNYPDVVKVKDDIARLKKRIAQQEAAEKSGKTQQTAVSKPFNILAEPVEIRQLRAQLHSLEESIQSNQREQARIRREIASYEARLKMTPAVEQQYKDITRNYQTALEFYNSLLAKEDQSQMSTSLEKRQEGEQFSVLDPANLPHKPSFPDYLRFAGGGLVVGLLLGFGAVLLLEMRDKALRDERDIEYFLGVPTLGVVPALDSIQRNRRLLDWKARLRGATTKRLAG